MAETPAIVLSAEAEREYSEFSDRAVAEVASRNPQLDLLEQVLAEVADFIREKGLIVYGGMSIDSALRAAGAPPIYGDSAIPDWDFYSPTHAADAYEIAKRLRRRFPALKPRALRAIHVTTVRVFIHGLHNTAVADVGFIPPNVLERIPTLTRDGIRYVHPRWQYVDQHHALSLPFGGFPEWDNFAGRWRKDIARYARLWSVFPIRAAGDPFAGGFTEAPTADPTLFPAKSSGSLGWGYSGFAALALIVEAHRAELTAAAKKHSAIGALLALGVVRTKSDGIRLRVPTAHRSEAWPELAAVDLFTPGVDEATIRKRAAAASKIETAVFERTIDVIARRTECRVGDKHTVAAFIAEDTEGAFIPALTIKALGERVRVVGPDTLLRQLAVWGNLRGAGAKPVKGGAAKAPDAGGLYWGAYAALRAVVYETDLPLTTGSYWSRTSVADAVGLLGSEVAEDSHDSSRRELAALRTGKDDPVLATAPLAWGPAGGEPAPQFVPRPPWFTLDGRRLAE
jgi:hypothetical protein